MAVAIICQIQTVQIVSLLHENRMSVNDQKLKILGHIKILWPDFPCTKEILLRPTPEFVVSFFTKLITELNDKVGFLIDSDLPFESDEVKTFEPEVYLFCKVAKLYKKLNSAITLTLNDFYQPNPKRNNMLMMLGLHFLLYVDSVVDDASVLVNDIFSQALNLQSLEDKKQDLMQRISQVAEQLSQVEDNYEDLKMQHEDVAKSHVKMKASKDENDKLYSAQQLEIERLSKELEGLEYRLKYQQAEEKELLEQVVTDADFQSLKETEKCLEQEESELVEHDANFGDGLDEQKNILTHINECTSLLKSMNFETLQIDQLKNIEESLREKNETLGRLKHKLDTLTALRESKDNDTNAMQAKSETLEREHSELLQKRAECLDFLNIEYERKIKEHKAQLSLSDSLKESIDEVKREIAEIETDERLVKEEFAATYRRILEGQNHTVTEFNKHLINYRDKTKPDSMK